MIISKFVVFYSKDLLNFTYTLTKPQDGNFGRLRKDGTWNGMIRLLQNRDVDIGLFCLFLERKLALLVTFQFERVVVVVVEKVSDSVARKQRIMCYTVMDMADA